MQTIFLSENTNQQQDTTSLEEYIGIRHQFPDPYHLYLRIVDITEKSPIVRFVCYSMGKKKVVMSGMYRRRDDSFYIMYACRYSLPQLNEYLQEWRDSFRNTLNMTKNRIDSRIQSFGGGSQNPLLTTHSDYVQLKAWLSLQPTSRYNVDYIVGIEGLISPEYQQRLLREVRELRDIERISQELLDRELMGDDIDSWDLQEDIEVLLQVATSKLDRMIEEYEKRLNIVQKQSSNRDIVDISMKFYDWISSSRYATESWSNGLERCSCTQEEPGSPGCQILEWGEEIDLL